MLGTCEDQILCFVSRKEIDQRSYVLISRSAQEAIAWAIRKVGGLRGRHRNTAPMSLHSIREDPPILPPLQYAAVPLRSGGARRHLALWQLSSGVPKPLVPRRSQPAMPRRNSVRLGLPCRASHALSNIHAARGKPITKRIKP